MATEESKTKQLVKIAKTLPHLPDLSFGIGKFRKLLRRAKRFYKEEWREKEKPSPAFNNRVVLATNYGWRHLLGKTVTTTHKDAIKRLNHLPNAKQILEKASFIYETIKEVDKRGKIVNRHSVIGKLENGVILKVAVKEVDKKLIFVTVFDPAKIKKDDKETHELQGSE